MEEGTGSEQAWRPLEDWPAEGRPELLKFPAPAQAGARRPPNLRRRQAAVGPRSSRSSAEQIALYELEAGPWRAPIAAIFSPATCADLLSPRPTPPLAGLDSARTRGSLCASVHLLSPAPKAFSFPPNPTNSF